MEELGSVTLRMVKVSLQEEREEILITNLPSETFDRFQIAELYQMRWGIETAYETLKDRLQIENFTGTKPVANSHFLRTAGPHFPDSPGHIKRTAWDISRAEGTPPH